MKLAVASFRFIHVRVLALGAVLLFVAQAHAQANPLPSWNDSPAIARVQYEAGLARR